MAVIGHHTRTLSQMWTPCINYFIFRPILVAKVKTKQTSDLYAGFSDFDSYSLFRFYQIIFCVAFFNWTAFHTCPLELGLELEPNIWKFIIFACTLKQFLDSHIFAIFVCYHICFFKSITLHLHTSSPNWQLITLTIWRQPSPRTICPSTLGQRAE